MATVQSMDENTTTAIVDFGMGPVVVYVHLPIEDVKKALQQGDWAVADSSVGEIHFTKDIVKALWQGKRELHVPVPNRSGLPQLPI